MKRTAIFAIFALSLITAACSKPDDAKPVEQELITTLKLMVVDSAGDAQTFVYRVENGFGGSTPGTVHIDTIILHPGKTYTVTTLLYNEKANPVQDVTAEVLQEKDMHLFLYQTDPASGGGSIACSNGSKDSKGLPFNQTITFTTGKAGHGTLQVDLMHQPTDKKGTTPATAGGETDAEAVFPLIID